MKKIVLTGPECSGKTTLSIEISKGFQLPLVSECARKYLSSINRNYNYQDLLQIARMQLDLETENIRKYENKKILICDTNLQVIKIWSFVKFAKCDPFIINNEDPKALYILCKPDFKWIYDPLREDKNNRDSLFELYKKDLVKNNRQFIIADGSIKRRIKMLNEKIKHML